MKIEAIVYSLLIISLLAVCDNRYSRKYYVPIKAVCSASFLIILEIGIYKYDINKALAWPLIACFVGDVLMGMYNTYNCKKYIIEGIISFMIAHGFFVLYMMKFDSHTGLETLLIPVIVVICMYYLIKRIHLHMGRVIYPGLVYCYFVSLMCLKSIEVGGIISVAGIMFFLSDFSILFLYFYHFKRKNNKKIVHYFNLVTYYFAIFLFLYSK